jgi:hypothetical protein
MDEGFEQNFMLVIGGPPQLGRIKQNDICRIAQRQIDSGARCTSHTIFHAARPRIPGKFIQYVYTLNGLVKRSALKPRRSH